MKRCLALFSLLFFIFLLFLPSAFALDAGTVHRMAEQGDAKAQTYPMGTVAALDNAKQNIFIDGEINYKKVMKILYGDLTYKNGIYDQPAKWNNIQSPWEEITYSTGMVYLAFEGKYTENGIQKYIILTQTPKSEDNTCRACAPIIGGAVFARYNNRWILENENKYIAITGNWGWMYLPHVIITPADGPNSYIDLIKIGPDKYGICYKNTDFLHGEAMEWIQLIVPYKNTIIDALRIDLISVTEDFHDCADNQFAKNDSGIRLISEPNEASSYYDFTVVQHYNKGSCSDGATRSVKESTRYTFANGYYKAVQP